jgi:signal recognition particle GTPase
VLKSVEPGQQFIKVFHDALTDLLGGEASACRSPTVAR